MFLIFIFHLFLKKAFKQCQRQNLIQKISFPYIKKILNGKSLVKKTHMLSKVVKHPPILQPQKYKRLDFSYKNKPPQKTKPQISTILHP